MPDAPQQSVSQPIKLRSLAPSFNENQHGVYVEALTRALRDQEDVRNIALTGAYGTGKSSVLQRLTELDEFKDRVLELSLSTVGVSEERPKGDSDANPAAWTTTNLIQKEIVKQILYRDAPEKTRGSRFRRLSRFRWPAEIGIALTLGALLFLIMWITGLAAPFVGWLGDDPDVIKVIVVNAALLVVLAGLVYAIRWATHNRVFLEKLSAGPATVTLAATSSSYFDQYVDEIVYYFEQSGRDVVIFEDIDRFEDVHIFETLRALNTLLNGSDQVRRRRTGARPQVKISAHPPFAIAWITPPVPDVKFVYALRDSVFERLGDAEAAPAAAPGDTQDGRDPADPLPTNAPSDVAESDASDDEVRRANRTKFFDIVIPVVPFITHRNARDLMIDTMQGTGVSRALINVAARFVADMRLVSNMRNEFDIYANRLLGTPNQMPGLDADRLFALIIYKSVHMADFEAIRFGSSDLDRLHDAWRDIVNVSIEDAQLRERTAAKRLSMEGLLPGRAKALGDRLERIMHALPAGQNYPAHVQIVVGGQNYQGPQLRESEFWTRVSGERASMTLSNSYSGPAMNVSYDQLQTLMGSALDPSDWLPVDRQAQVAIQQAAKRELEFLRHHAWNEIYDRREFTDAGSDTREPATFENSASRILKSRLARALVAAGYINDYFALYVSIYYGEHLRPRALNYVVHSLDRGVADIQYELDGEDVEAIIGDKGLDIFRDRAAYNLNVLDHLLAKRPDEAELIVRQVATWDRADRTFGRAYIETGAEKIRFVRMIAPLMPETIASVVVEAPEDELAELLDAALDYAGSAIGSPATSEFAELIIENYRMFPSISTAAGDTSKLDLRKHQTIDAIAKLGIQLPETAGLKTAARRRAEELGAYELNAANIKHLTAQPSLALDAIRSGSEAVYAAALGRVGEYFAVIAAGGASTINDPSEFVPILSHAVEAAVDKSDLYLIIELASESCHLSRLIEAPEAAWPALAATGRVDASATNLLAYIDNVGGVDENIGKLFADTSIVEQPEDVTESDRERLAIEIVNARSAISAAAHRVQLAASLNLSSSLPVSSLTPETGEMVGLLIEARLLSDDAATLSSTLIVDWATLESALARSAQASNFISPAVLPAAHLAKFFQSQAVPVRVKQAVVATMPGFIPGASRDGITAMSRFAAVSGSDVPFATIDQLRMSGAPEESIVALLVWSTTVSLPEIQAELRALGYPYPTIADRGTARPLVTDDDVHRGLLDRLKAAGIVSDHKSEPGGRRVFLRKP